MTPSSLPLFPTSSLFPCEPLSTHAPTLHAPGYSLSRQAISKLGMGLLDKVILQFDTKFWSDAWWIYTASASDLGYIINYNGANYLNESVLFAFVAGV